VAVGLVLAALAAVLALAVLRAGRPPSGPVDVPLDAATCAHCRMLVSDLSFAGQIHTAGGEVLFFDDPGCLLLHLDAVEVHASWLHHLRADRWVPLDGARFVPVPRSPMGYGLGAVGAEDAPDGLTAAQARTRLRARDASRSPAP
jgi:hypothetical protein